MLMQYFFNHENDETNSCSSSIAESIYKFHKSCTKYSSSIFGGLLGTRRMLIWQWVELRESALIKSDQLVLLTRAVKDWEYFLKMEFIVIYYLLTNRNELNSKNLSGGLSSYTNGWQIRGQVLQLDVQLMSHPLFVLAQRDVWPKIGLIHYFLLAT